MFESRENNSACDVGHMNSLKAYAPLFGQLSRHEFTIQSGSVIKLSQVCYTKEKQIRGFYFYLTLNTHKIFNLSEKYVYFPIV
jgi:hypothetical protein